MSEEIQQAAADRAAELTTIRNRAEDEPLVWDGDAALLAQYRQDIRTLLARLDDAARVVCSAGCGGKLYE